MKYAYLVSAAIALLLLVLLLSRRERPRAGYALASILLIAVMGQIANFLVEENLADAARLFMRVVSATPALIGPLSYLYVRALTRSGSIFRPRTIGHFAFFVLALVISLFFSDRLGGLVMSVLYYMLLKTLVTLIYLVASLRELMRHRRYVLDHFSSTQRIDFRWLQYFIGGELLVWLVYLSLRWLYLLDMHLMGLADTIVNGCASAFILLIGFHGLRNTSVFSTFSNYVQRQKDLAEPATERHTSTTRDIGSGRISKGIYPDLEPYRDRLLEFMEESGAFRVEGLTIQDVSVGTGIAENLLSRTISSIFTMNFFDFVNSYRIDLFDKKILEGEAENFTLLAVAMDCGFSSKSSFNRAYRKKMGMTPSQYRAENPTSH